MSPILSANVVGNMNVGLSTSWWDGMGETRAEFYFED